MTRARRPLLLVPVLALLIGCGGRSADEVRNLSEADGPTPELDGGAMVPGATAKPPSPHAGTGRGGAGSESPTEETGVKDAGPALPEEPPNTVTVEGVPNGTDEAAITSPTGPCFQGFRAEAGGMRVELQAFVQEPGEYSGDPIHILYVRVETEDGRTFVASTNGSTDGEIALHVTSVSPRFAGQVTATLPDAGEPEAAPLEVSITFDIRAAEPCNGAGG